MPARKELASAGFSKPTIRDFDDKLLDTRSLDKPIDVLMDVVTPQRRDDAFPGPFLRPGSDSGADAGAGHDRWKALSRPDPIPLLHANGPIGPRFLPRPFCRDRCSAGGLRDIFLRTGTADADERRSVAVLGRAERPTQPGRRADCQRTGRRHVADGNAGRARAVGDQNGNLRRSGLDARLYYAKTNTVIRAQQTAAIVGAIGLAA